MGDSIASGEGIDYGYTYTGSGVPHWTGGTRSPTWLGLYPGCHVSAQAYGGTVARRLRGRLTNLACTGSTYLNGIVGPRVAADGTPLRPAQFGDWSSGRGLNPVYDQVRPDLVLVTLGADDVQFVHILEACVADSIVDPLACTAADPGQTIQADYLAQRPTLRANYRALAAAIQARGRRDGKVPAVIFTTYPNPLPSPGSDISLARCPDAGHLSANQIAYLTSLVNQLDDLIESSLAGMKGVSVADVRSAYTGHALCSADPWVYGLSILAFANPDSQAPFHPTPPGQMSIARGVVAAARFSLGVG